MARLEDIRLDVHTSYTVKPDGTEGEVVSQTQRYVNAKDRKAYSSVEEALAEVNPDDLSGIEEGEIVEDNHEGETKESSEELKAQEAEEVSSNEPVEGEVAE